MEATKIAIFLVLLLMVVSLLGILAISSSVERPTTNGGGANYQQAITIVPRTNLVTAQTITIIPRGEGGIENE